LYFQDDTLPSDANIPLANDLDKLLHQAICGAMLFIHQIDDTEPTKQSHPQFLQALLQKY
jgi:hypothetical protein